MRNSLQKDRGVSDRLDREGSQAIGRAAALLREIATAPAAGIRLYHLAARLGMSRPTTHRILRRLVTEGLVELDPNTLCYRLGRLVYELGLKAAIPSEWRGVGADAVERVARACDDTAFMYARSGRDSVCLERREGSYPVRVLAMEPGQRRPMGTGAASLAMLALMSDAEIECILQDNRLRLDEMGEMQSVALWAYVEQSRQTGYVIKPVLRFPEIVSMAVAVRHPQGDSVLALSVSSVAARVTAREQELLSLLNFETARLLPRLGGAVSSALH